MSTHSSAASDGSHAGGATLSGYLIGFGLALVLTVIPFGVVAFADLSATVTLAVVAVAAVIQILVHLHFFLHLDMSAEQRWNGLSAVFSLVIIVLLVGGTVWLFYSLNYRMMIGH